MIVLDYKDRRPLYEQVAERFRELIVRGILLPDTQMPSVRSQAMELSINPNTIQRAYSQLEQQGYIYSIKGKGSFVADTGGIMKEQRDRWREEFTGLVQKGLTLGISREEMEAILQKAAGKQAEQDAGGRQAGQDIAEKQTEQGAGGKQAEQDVAEKQTRQDDAGKQVSKALSERKGREKEGRIRD